VLFATPHLAIVLGNLYSYAVSAPDRLILSLRKVEQLSDTVFEFIFQPHRRLAFASGQYLEWTLPHAKSDSGGNRRYFTIASAPQDDTIRIGVRIDARASNFKQSLRAMRPGDTLLATSLAGDFTLPQDARQKLLFIAGGVGITPFASMLRDLMHRKEPRDIVLFYAANTPEDLAYRTLLEEAQRSISLQVVYVTGTRITKDDFTRIVPDITERVAYISGPEVMVRAYTSLLHKLRAKKIKTDYFTGFTSAL
jgi:ferredoxin-NADP reductase